jgi:hypothetical protein
MATCQFPERRGEYGANRLEVQRQAVLGRKRRLVATALWRKAFRSERYP